jgi:hypothetical protein
MSVTQMTLDMAVLISCAGKYALQLRLRRCLSRAGATYAKGAEIFDPGVFAIKDGIVFSMVYLFRNTLPDFLNNSSKLFNVAN